MKSIADSFRYLVVGARGVSTDAEATDNLSILVYGYAATKEDQAACDLIKPAPLSCRRREKRRIKEIRLSQTI